MGSKRGLAAGVQEARNACKRRTVRNIWRQEEHCAFRPEKIEAGARRNCELITLHEIFVFKCYKIKSEVKAVATIQV